MKRSLVMLISVSFFVMKPTSSMSRSTPSDHSTTASFKKDHLVIFLSQVNKNWVKSFPLQNKGCAEIYQLTIFWFSKFPVSLKIQRNATGFIIDLQGVSPLILEWLSLRYNFEYALHKIFRLSNTL